jgi:transcriptional regulator with XRE-family HTH domain
MEDTAAPLLDEIPPARLGELLREARRRRGWKRKEVAAQVAIDADHLRAWERGTERVPSDVLSRLAGLFDDDLAVPARQPVSADSDWLVVGPYEQALMEGTSEEVIQGYIKIVKRLRKTKPGKSLELRADDVQVLAHALQGDPADIERRIADALGCSREEARALHAEMLRRKVLLPVASLAVGVAAIAGVSHAASADAAAPSAPAPNTPAIEQVAQVREMWDAVLAPTITVAPTTTTVPAPPVTTAVVPIPDTRVEHPQPDPLVQPVTTTTAISHLEIIEGQQPTGDVGILPGEDQHGPILGPPDN